MPRTPTQQELVDKLAKAISNQKAANDAAAAASKVYRSSLGGETDVIVEPV
tara:strand:- start:1038 stop:1190 length:153 start_codon:yes stop_codon:yes gene_type:complete